MEASYQLGKIYYYDLLEPNNAKEVFTDSGEFIKKMYLQLYHIHCKELEWQRQPQGQLMVGKQGTAEPRGDSRHC